MSQKTEMSKQAMSGISTICQRSRLFPALKAAECSDAVPRIGGMKISLFIMGANQISAFAFKLKGDGNVQSGMAVTNTLLVHPHPDLNTKGPTLVVQYLSCFVQKKKRKRENKTGLTSKKYIEVLV